MTREEAKATKAGDAVVQWNRQDREHQRGVVVVPWDGRSMRVRWDWMGPEEDLFVWEPKWIKLVPVAKGQG